jgi:hypothetical protein
LSLLTDGVGLTVSAYFVNNINAACIMGAIIQIPLVLIAGFFIPIHAMPAFIRPLSYLSYYRLGFESFIITFYGFGRCAPPEPITIHHIKQTFGEDVIPVMGCIDEYGLLDNITDKFESFSEELLKCNPSILMQGFNLNDNDLYLNMAFMIVYAIVLKITAFCVLQLRANSIK